MSRQYSAYFGLEKELAAQGFSDTRADLIATYTEGKKSGLKELTADEYVQFLNWLKKRFNLGTVAEKMDRMRKKLIAILKHQMNFSYKEIDEWCIKYGQGETLNHNNYEQLIKLVTAAEKMYADYQKKLAK